MELATLQTFFGWCTILHIGLMMFASIMLLALNNWVYKIHSKWFPMSRETYNAIVYSFLGVYKLMIWVFCLIPWVALLIMNK